MEQLSGFLTHRLRRNVWTLECCSNELEYSVCMNLKHSAKIVTLAPNAMNNSLGPLDG